MNAQQYENWRDFALRMATVCYGRSRRPSGAWVLEQVTEFIDGYADDHMEIQDWDSRPDYICDAFADFEHDATPGFWFEEDPRAEDQELPEGWEERAEERAELARQRWQAQFMGPVACCVRAGLDMATVITGGVVGFTVGNLRAMFPGGIPEYVQRHYPSPLDQAGPQEGLWL